MSETLTFLTLYSDSLGAGKYTVCSFSYYNLSPVEMIFESWARFTAVVVNTLMKTADFAYSAYGCVFFFFECRWSDKMRQDVWRPSNAERWKSSLISGAEAVSDSTHPSLWCDCENSDIMSALWRKTPSLSSIWNHNHAVQEAWWE